MNGEQWAIHRPHDRRLFVVIQHDLLDQSAHRVGIPLLPLAEHAGAVSRLMPVLDVEGVAYLARTDLTTTLRLKDLGPRIGSARDQREALVRAVDVLLGGV